MSLNSRATKVFRLIFDSIEEIVSIIIAIQILYVEIVDPSKLNAMDLIPRILAIVTLLAISSLRDKLYRFRRISRHIQDIHSSLQEKVFDPIRAKNLFREGVEPDTKFLENAEQICISGISLVRSIGKFHEVLNNQVIKGAKVRVMLLDSSKDDAISQLKLRSWGPVRDGYYETRIGSTEGQIEVIGENIRSSSNTLGSLELGLLPFVPSFGVLLVDPHNFGKGRAWIEIYHHRTDNPSPRFIIEKSRDAKWFDFFHEQFEEMWKLCEVRKIV